MDLTQILRYEMNPIETSAFKCCLIWQKCCLKMFKNTSYSKLRKTGDPRKSYLFKCCYKLIQERKGVIKDDEFALFIYAQLSVIKKVGETTDQILSIDPTCLSGDKAWYRWKVWKKQYDKAKQFHVVTTKQIGPGDNFICKELDKTKEFLADIYKGDPSKKEISSAHENRTMMRWLHMGKVSPYFVVMSDLPQDGWGMDLTLYKEHLNTHAHEYYAELFS